MLKPFSTQINQRFDSELEKKLQNHQMNFNGTVVFIYLLAISLFFYIF